MFKDLKLDKKRLKVISFNNLTIDLCKKYNASAIIRGLRAVSDFEYEFQLAGMNKKLNSKIETMFLMSDIENQIISSKFVKEIVSLGGNIDRFVTKYAAKMLKRKIYMKKLFYLFLITFSLLIKDVIAKDIMLLKLTYGEVEIELYPEKAPNHVKRFKELADSGKYDGVVFHRVIDGFMAQTGDVKFGNTNSPEFNLSLAGTGGSDLPNLKAEFTNIAHSRGILSAARSADPNSANSQFFICFEDAPHLDRQYSAFGKVIKGMEFVDKIKKGDPNSGAVSNPDKILSLRSK